MKNTFKKLLSVILFAVLLFTTASVAFAAEEARTVVDSGYCGAQGENLIWTLYSDGELVINGEGEMQWYYVDYNDKEPDVDVPPPWYNYYPVIDVITFEEGVTGIGNAAFSGEYNRFHKVNLPVSLQYFDGEFYWDEKTCDQGRCIVVCYAGTEEQWNQVERRTYSYSLNSEKNGYNRKPNSVVRGYKFDRKRADFNDVLLCFNGENPAPFIKLKNTGVQTDIDLTERFPARKYGAFYYPGDYENLKINWKIKGDSIEVVKIGVDSGSTDLVIEQTIKAVRYGECELVAELIDENGNVLDSDSVAFKSHVPVGMNLFEAIKYYGEFAFIGVATVGAMGSVYFLIILEYLLMLPIALFEMISPVFGLHYN